MNDQDKAELDAFNADIQLYYELHLRHFIGMELTEMVQAEMTAEMEIVRLKLAALIADEYASIIRRS